MHKLFPVIPKKCFYLTGSCKSCLYWWKEHLKELWPSGNHLFHFLIQRETVCNVQTCAKNDFTSVAHSCKDFKNIEHKTLLRMFVMSRNKYSSCISTSWWTNPSRKVESLQVEYQLPAGLVLQLLFFPDRFISNIYQIF